MLELQGFPQSQQTPDTLCCMVLDSGSVLRLAEQSIILTLHVNCVAAWESCHTLIYGLAD